MVLFVCFFLSVCHFFILFIFGVVNCLSVCQYITCHFRTILSPLIELVFFSSSVMFVCLPSHLGILIMNFCLCLVEFSES